MPVYSVEAVELLVASLFSDEAPLAPPSTGLAGFLRFLLLLAGHDWTTAPLLVDPQGELSAADRAAAVEAFSRSRERGEMRLWAFPRGVPWTWTLERASGDEAVSMRLQCTLRVVAFDSALSWVRACCVT